ncbi:MAG: P-II family nitrogen regulator [Defluviitaleaceae bacterium]|nr:P-II family nitrogen regulator [Defluviitaleaceae bacterium]
MLNNIELLIVIVEFGMGSKMIKLGRKAGLGGGTIFVGYGTAKKSRLDFWELGMSRQEIVLMGGTNENIHDALILVKEKLHLERPGKGVALSIPINTLMRESQVSVTKKNTDEGGKKPMYNVIYTIVEMGKSDEVLEAARKAGSTGATVMTGRGSGIHEQSHKLFGMEIEPQKEIVMIIAHVDKAVAITASIRKELEIDEPGHGIIFTIPVDEIHGLHEDEK